MTESPEAVIYSSSVKIEMTAKGLAMVTVHIYSNNDEEARSRAVTLYQKTIGELEKMALPTACTVEAKK